MLFSVVIPCHNAGRWIGEALRSVAEQTVKAHEIIVIDDASTDDSVAQVEASGVPVRLLRVCEKNAAATRNHGIRAATGDWIALLDADDRWYPNHLERAATLLGKSVGDVAYRGSCDEMDTAGRTTPVHRPQPLQTSRTGLTHEDYPDLEMAEMYFAHSTFVLRRDRLLEIGGYDPAQMRRHDIDMWLRLIAGRTWCFDSTPTAAYRLYTPGSIGQSLASCEYYYLKAWLRNRQAYAGPALDRLLRKTARRAMSLAFMNGSRDDFERTSAIAWPFLSWRHRMAYGAAGWFPAPWKLAIRAKRTWFTMRTGHRLPAGSNS